MSLTFREPPPANTGGPTGRASAAWLRTAHELRQRAGDWAVIKTCVVPSQAAGLASRVKDGEIVAFAPKGTFEACYRREADGTATVYARAVPAAAAPEATVTRIARTRKAAGGAR